MSGESLAFLFGNNAHSKKKKDGDRVEIKCSRKDEDGDWKDGRALLHILHSSPFITLL
jgi:hypothetical protein